MNLNGNINAVNTRIGGGITGNLAKFNKIKSDQSPVTISNYDFPLSLNSGDDGEFTINKVKGEFTNIGILKEMNQILSNFI